jgi:hypothetical protein
MDASRIAELRALAEKATPGPWIVIDDAGLGHGPADAVNAFDWDAVDTPDAAFIAAARTALPEALDAIERVRALCAEWYPLVGAGRNAAIGILAALEGKP